MSEKKRTVMYKCGCTIEAGMGDLVASHCPIHHKRVMASSDGIDGKIKFNKDRINMLKNQIDKLRSDKADLEKELKELEKMKKDCDKVDPIEDK
jgi:hypothetical protein